ncbi:hypothetical protein OIU79_015922, partial [Salix purpurea]
MKEARNEVERQKAELANFKGQVDLLEKQVKEARNEVDRQKAELAKLSEQIVGHAQEMAAAKDLHDQEMAAAAERHAHEMDKVKMEYSLKYL